MTETHFVMVPPWVSRGGVLDPYAKAVYINLLSRQGANTQAWPAHATISRETLMGVSRVKKAIKDLEGMGLLKKVGRVGPDGRQTSNSYTVSASPPGSVKTAPQSSNTYKEDSSQEYSILNSSSSKSARVWTDISDEYPPSAKQLGYLGKLMEEVRELDEHAANELEDLALITARDVSEAIKGAFAIKMRLEYPEKALLARSRRRAPKGARQLLPGGYPLPPGVHLARRD